MNAMLKPDAHLSPDRCDRITGSRVSTILGLNPYAKRHDVIRDMVRQHFGAEPEFTGNAATEHGTAREPDALAAYEAQAGVMTYGGGELLIHPDHDFLAVTPDGLVGDDGMVECKAPYSATYCHADERPDYVAQMQLQMACAGRQWCDFVVYRDGEIHVSRVALDPQWLPSAMPELQAFMADYRAAIASKEAAAPHLADKVADMEGDLDWGVWADAYSDAKADEEAAKARADLAREKLIELAQATGSKNAKGCGWQVIRTERAGSIAYAKAVKDLAPDADLSAYTGKPSTTYMIRESK
ncbi:MAG TPA: YqaJ viral recombinase family protein [Nitrobacter sp.]|nr:YqaJ viral recombinase family protein [Nitrobacter sp.]